MTDKQLWQQAASFAARAHLGQMRRDGKTPYVAHPLRVAMEKPPTSPTRCGWR